MGGKRVGLKEEYCTETEVNLRERWMVIVFTLHFNYRVTLIKYILKSSWVLIFLIEFLRRFFRWTFLLFFSSFPFLIPIRLPSFFLLTPTRCERCTRAAKMINNSSQSQILKYSVIIMYLHNFYNNGTVVVQRGGRTIERKWWSGKVSQ